MSSAQVDRKSYEKSPRDGFHVDVIARIDGDVFGVYFSGQITRS